MLKSISFLILFYIPSIVLSQEYDYQLGDIEDCNGAEIVRILGEIDEGVLLHRHDLNNGKNYIEVFNEKMNLKSSTQVKAPSNLTLVEILFAQGKAYAFMSETGGKGRLFASVISSDGTINDQVVVAENNGGYYRVRYYAHSLQFLITANPPYNRSDNGAVQFDIVDLDLNKVAERKVNLGFDDIVQLYNFLLDKDGNIHFVVLSNALNEKGKNFIDNRKEAQLFSLFKGEQEFIKFNGEIIDGSNYLSDIKVTIDDAGNLRCIGFYSDRGGRYAKGAFAFTLDAEDRKIKNLKSEDFSVEFVNKFLTGSQLKRKNKRIKKGKKTSYMEIPGLRIVNLYTKPDGGIYVLSECFNNFLNNYTSSTGDDFESYTSSLSGVNPESQAFLGLGIFSVSNDNSIESKVHIAKSQVSSSNVTDWGRYSGVFAFLTESNSLNIVFNTEQKDAVKLEKPKRHGYLNSKELHTVIVEIDDQGNASKTPIFSHDETSIMSLPRYAYLSSDGNILIYGQWNKKRRLMRVLLSE